MNYQRIICPNPKHVEATPSCVIYEEHFHCYGCGHHGKISELQGVNIQPVKKVEPENIEAALEYIRKLPTALVRGLPLPVDRDRFYIPWPCGRYYKSRQFISNGGAKYRNPRGHAKPLFIAKDEARSPLLTLVEGELNALSLASIGFPGSIASPGGVGDFGERLEKHSAFILRHSRFLLVLDSDGPGLAAAIETKKALLRHSSYVEIVLMPEDANDLLQKGTLKDETEKWKNLVVLSGVPGF